MGRYTSGYVTSHLGRLSLLPFWDGKMISAVGLSNNKWRLWMWFPSSLQAKAGLWLKSVGLVQRSAAVWRCSAFIAWTGWTLAMTLSHDDSTINIVLVIIIHHLHHTLNTANCQTACYNMALISMSMNINIVNVNKIYLKSIVTVIWYHIIELCNLVKFI